MTVQRLPAELMIRILELATEEHPDARWRSYPTLRSAALVSKAWSGPACELLWRTVAIESEAQADAFIASAGLTQYRTKLVYLNGWDVHLKIRRILEQLAGVVTLEVTSSCASSSEVAVSSAFLGLASLSGLTSLTLACRMNRLRYDGGPPSFRLRHLTLGGNFKSSPIYTKLLSTSSHTLQSLDLSAAPYAIQFFPIDPTLRLPNLATFNFNWFGHTQALQIIPTCPSLQHLFAKVALPGVIRKVFDAPLHPLRSLSLTGCVENDIEFDTDTEEIVKLLVSEMDRPLLSKLEVLVFGKVSAGYLASTADGRQLLEKLEKRGVRLEVALRRE